MKIGMTEAVITPPLGMHIPGLFATRTASGVKDELYAKAMVMDCDNVIMAFVVLDIISLELESAIQIRERINQLTGIPTGFIMIACTHTHTGPPRPLNEEAVSYYPTLEATAADAAVRAFNRRVPARMGCGRGLEADLVFNRRFFMLDGTLRTNPGILNPDIREVEGPVDPEIVVVRIDDEDGHPIGVVSNYACHTDTVGGTEYSADYPGYISKTIKKQMGEQTVSLFFQGACGNINHIDVSGRLDCMHSTYYQRMGERLGGEIVKVHSGITTDSTLLSRKAAVKSRFVQAGQRVPSDWEIALIRGELEALALIPTGKMTDKQISMKRRAENAIAIKASPPAPATYEIQVSVIGELAIVALPSEMFVEFGLHIKAASPYAYTIVTELSNGSGDGYVCTAAACESGGYEPSGRHFAAEAGDAFTAAAVELLYELHKD